jgi:MinD-like ATPase involved in chromosome partitioning or flagellar assembly
MEVPLLGPIPVDPEVVKAGDAGIPLLGDGPQSPAAQAFGKVVEVILAGTSRTQALSQEDSTTDERPIATRGPVDSWLPLGTV